MFDDDSIHQTKTIHIQIDFMTVYLTTSSINASRTSKTMLRKDFQLPFSLIVSHFQAVVRTFFGFGNVLCRPLLVKHSSYLHFSHFSLQHFLSKHFCWLFVCSSSVFSCCILPLGRFFLFLCVRTFLASLLINFYVKHTFRGFAVCLDQNILLVFTTFSVFGFENSSKRICKVMHICNPSAASIFNRRTIENILQRSFSIHSQHFPTKIYGIFMVNT